MSLAESHAAPIGATAPGRTVGPETGEAEAPVRRDAPAESATARSGAQLSARAAGLILGGIALAAMLLQGGLFFEKTWLWTGDTIYHHAVMAEIQAGELLPGGPYAGLPAFYSPLLHYLAAGIGLALRIELTAAIKVLSILFAPLTPLAAYWLARTLGLERAVALAGAFFATFGGGLKLAEDRVWVDALFTGQHNFFPLFPRDIAFLLLPLGFGCVYRGLVRGRRFGGVMAGLAFGLMILAHTQTAVFAAPVLGLYLLVALLLRPDLLGRAARVSAVTAGVALLVSSFWWVWELSTIVRSGSFSVEMPASRVPVKLALSELPLEFGVFLLLGPLGLALTARRLWPGRNRSARVGTPPGTSDEVVACRTSVPQSDPLCHSERSEESRGDRQFAVEERGILRCAQNDTPKSGQNDKGIRAQHDKNGDDHKWRDAAPSPERLGALLLLVWWAAPVLLAIFRPTGFPGGDTFFPRRLWQFASQPLVLMAGLGLVWALRAIPPLPMRRRLVGAMLLAVGIVAAVPGSVGTWQRIDEFWNEPSFADRRWELGENFQIGPWLAGEARAHGPRTVLATTPEATLVWYYAGQKVVYLHRTAAIKLAFDVGRLTGYDEGERHADLLAAYRGDPLELERVAEKYGATYVVLERYGGGLAGVDRPARAFQPEGDGRADGRLVETNHYEYLALNPGDRVTFEVWSPTDRMAHVLLRAKRRGRVAATLGTLTVDETAIAIPEAELPRDTWSEVRREVSLRAGSNRVTLESAAQLEVIRFAAYSLTPSDLPPTWDVAYEDDWYVVLRSGVGGRGSGAGGRGPESWGQETRP